MSSPCVLNSQHRVVETEHMYLPSTRRNDSVHKSRKRRAKPANRNVHAKNSRANNHKLLLRSFVSQPSTGNHISPLSDQNFKVIYETNTLQRWCQSTNRSVNDHSGRIIAWQRSAHHFKAILRAIKYIKQDTRQIIRCTIFVVVLFLVTIIPIY